MEKEKLLLTSLLLICLCSCNKNKGEEINYNGAHEIKRGDSKDGLTHLDTPYYTYVDYYNLESNGSLLMIPHFETYQQRLSYTCGACSAWMVLNYLDPVMGKTYNEGKVATECGSTGEGRGTSALQIANFFIAKDYEVEYSCSHEKVFTIYDEFVSFVKEHLQNQEPIMVDWATGSGHWTTIIGFDDMGNDQASDDVLIFADSSDSYDHFYDGYTITPARRFFSMWRETTPWDGEQIYLQQYVIVKKK
mgnify:CR=1 FL=1